MNSKISPLRNKLKGLILDKEVIEIVVFGSAIKGKITPGDIDIAVISHEKPSPQLLAKIKKLEEFHVSMLTAKEFLIDSPSIVHTLIREGYGLKNKKLISENFRFVGKALFTYNLVQFASSPKVKIVNILRGKKGEKGIVEKNGGEWLANQTFTVPLNAEKIFEEFFSNFKINYSRFYILMH